MLGDGSVREEAENNRHIPVAYLYTNDKAFTIDETTIIIKQAVENHGTTVAYVKLQAKNLAN